MNPHELVVDQILRAVEPLGFELRLIARLADPCVGNGSNREVFFFIPDLHLVSQRRRARFGRYGFNHEDTGTLAAILERMTGLRQFWDDTGDHKLVTVQLGDFLDLWREFPRSPSFQDLGDEEHGTLRDLLYRNRARGRPSLKATMLFGNHDSKGGKPLPEIPWQLRAFNRSAEDRPFLFATHGDAFDVIERLLPDAIQERFVEFIGRLTPINEYDIGAWARAATHASITPRLGDMDRFITSERHDLTMTDGAPRVRPGARLPRRLCHTVGRPKDAPIKSFESFYGSVRRGARRFPSLGSLRLAVVGHSHDACLAVHEPGGNAPPFVMLDVGAWIENCSYPLAEGGTTVEPSAQLGVVHHNDVRLYQVRHVDGA